MDLHETVKIGAVTYRIGFKKNVVDDADTLGHIGYRDQRITIKKGMGADMIREALVHECLHGMTFAISHEASDEKIVRRLAPVLLEFLRDNPELVDFLRG